MRLYWKLFVSVFLLGIFLAGTNVFAAGLELHGQVFYDAYVYSQDAEGFAGTGYTTQLTSPGSGGIAGVTPGTVPAAADRKSTYFDLNHATAIRGHWRNQEGLGAFFGMYMNADPSQSSTTGSGGFNVGVSVAVMYWDVTPKLRLIAGKGGADTVFSPEDPTRYMGYDGIAHVTGLGYGNINSKYQNNVRMVYKFNDNVSLDLAMMNPRLSAAGSYAAFGPGFTAKAGTAVENHTTIPKIEAALPMNYKGSWGNIKFTPSAMYLKSEFENVASGEDSLTSYGLAASTVLNIENLKLEFEYNYGQNLANAARTGESQVTPFKWEYIVGGLWKGMAARVVNGQVYDGKTNAFYVEAGYEIAKLVTPTLLYGRNESERDMDVLGGGYTCRTTTQMYSFSLPIKVTPNLTIAPEYTIWDNGDSNVIDGVVKDFGKESLVGVQMRLIF